MGRLFRIVVILFTLSSTITAQYSSLKERIEFLPLWEKIFAPGLQALQEGRLEQAEQYFRTQLSNGSKQYSFEAEFFQMVALTLSQEKTQAAASQRRLARQDRRRFEQLGGLYWTGWLQVFNRQFFVAADPLLEQLTLSGKAGYIDYSDEVRYLLASIAIELNEHAKAFELYEQLNGPLESLAGLPYGSLLLAEEEYQRAYQIFTSFLAQAQVEGKEEALFLQGEAAYQAGSLPQARTAFETYLRLYKSGTLATTARIRLVMLQYRQERSPTPLQNWHDIDVARLQRQIMRQQLPAGQIWDKLYQQVQFYVALDAQDYAQAAAALQQQPVESLATRQIIDFNRALLLLHSGSYTPGIRILQELSASKNFGLAAEALYHLGRGLISQPSHRQQGISTLEDFLARYPRGKRRFEVYQILFDLYYEFPQRHLQQIGKLISQIKQDPEADPQALLVFSLKTAESYRLAGDEKTALEYYHQLYQQAPQHPLGLNARYRMAYVYAQRNEYTRALDMIKDVLGQSSDRQLLYQSTLLATNLLLALQKHDQALVYLDTLIEIATDEQQRQEAKLQKGIAFYRLNRYQEALTIFNQVSEYDRIGKPQIAGLALFWRGATYFRTGDFTRSQQDFANVANNYPLLNRAEALYRAALSAEANDDYRTASKLLQEALPLFNNDQFLYREAATRLIKVQLLGQEPSQARAQARSYLRQEGGEQMISSAFLQAAESFFNQNKLAESLAILESFSNYFPSLQAPGELLYLQASIYLQTAAYADAAQLLIDYLNKEPNGEFVQSVALTLAQLVRQGSTELSGAIQSQLNRNLSPNLRNAITVAWLARQPPSIEKINRLKELYQSQLPDDTRSEIVYQLGKTYLAMEREEEGKALIFQLFAPEVDAFWRGAAQMEWAAYLHGQGEIVEATPLYEEIVDQYSSFPELVAEALYRLVDIWRWRGRDDLSQAYQQKLLQEHRGSKWSQLLSQ